MSFINSLKLVCLRNSNKYKLTDEFSFIAYLRENTVVVTVPKGTITDFASVPRFVKFWLDDNDSTIRDASVIHDYLYSTDSTCCYGHIDRWTADVILCLGMKCLNATAVERTIVFIGVRCFGWMFYKKTKV